MMNTAARRAMTVGLMLALGGVAAPVADASSKSVLVIHAYGHEAPGRGVFDMALARALREATDPPIDLYVETLDSTRFDELQAQRTRQYLRAKYGDRDIGVVVAVYDPALAFLRDSQDPLFPGVPIAAVVTGRAPTDATDVSVLFAGDTIGRSLALALDLHPHTRRVAIISSNLEMEGGDAPQHEARRQLSAIGVDLPISFVHVPALEELLDEVRSLPEDTLVLINRLAVRENGRPMSNPRAARAISREAQVPVYVISDQLVGSGPVGGIVIALESQAMQLARLIIEILRDPTSVRSVETVLAPVFDWRELRRWGISENRLPPESTIVFRQPNVWEEYRGYIVSAAALVALQSALIAGLMVQRARRRRMENALRENERRLHATVQQNQDLAGRLIAAQDAERTRIARDLHDDASQEVAGLAMSLGLLTARVNEATADGTIARSLTDLQERTVTLGENLRTLSHELHPGVLQHAGIAAALRSYTTEFGRRRGIPVRFEATEGFRDVGPEVALCLYRVAQEALANAGRHSGAGEVVVTLGRTHGCIQLSVGDNGTGFDVDRRDCRGLGLRSIDERVRLMGGTAQVTSTPGRGTTVVVRLPGPDVSEPVSGRTA